MLIDTGEGKTEYIPILRKALTDTYPSLKGPYISDIIITHKHRDHNGGLLGVLQLLNDLWREQVADSTLPYPQPRLHKFLLPQDEQIDAHLQPTLSSLSESGLYSSSLTHREAPFLPLKDRQILSENGITLEVLHTPGHTKDSICLYIPEDRALFTADNILGHGTAVFEDLSQYITSLETLLEFNKGTTESPSPLFQLLYPGHGPVLEDGNGTIKMYISHRLEREQQLVDLLRSRAGAWGVDEVVDAFYPPNVRSMAKRGVLLHLRKLEVDGKVSKENDESWRLLDV